MKKIKVRYSCTICKTVDREIEVPAREDPDAIDVAVWMERVVLFHIYCDHKARNPGCWSKTVKEIKVPMGAEDDPEAWVGKPQ